MHLSWRYFFILFIISTLPPFLDQSGASDFHSARTAALGGAGQAGPILNDSIYLNPSFNSFLQTYSISFNYLTYSGGDPLPDGTTTLHGRGMNISLQDGRSELFQAGVGYTQRNNANLLSFGASKTVLQNLGFGLGAKVFMPHSDSSLPYVRDSMFSVTFLPTDWVQTSLIIDNLFESDDGIQYGLYREFILGTKFNLINQVLIYFDPHVIPDIEGEILGYELGVEIGLFQDFFLRMGAYKNAAVPHEDGVRGRGVGFGVGWIGPRFSLDYGIDRTLEPTPEVAHIFGATLYF